MSYQTIKLDLSKDGVAILTLNQPQTGNLLDSQMRAEITDAAREAGRVARVLVLTGAGPTFCSGQNLSDRANLDNLDLERVLRDEYGPMLRAIYDCPVPTLAAVNGAAAGAGANLALAADVVIAKHSASFQQPLSRVGLIPDAGGTYWMTRNMGHAKAMGAALFGDEISAEQADQWGLIWAAVPDEEFTPHCKERALQLAKGPTLAYRRMKEAIRDSWNNDLQIQLEKEARHQGSCARSRDFKEGVVAFVEGRPPHFEGR
ncbi:enoyl-CoA hydratase-related protein [Thalassovita mediterranea]|jgi:2-(1,2-epoxy-1,2-dihydrophenyl)acetyl-CoA isomerase|uniref:1,2-epoxyphenylacetyl-CoA isomerase n=1 Tax=Thalassovita mediterranea TaxID=340021 RepID=A0A0N7M1I9_9RHOB|nr:enoyl-CoA hydratase-related protein [Thalassovita mediterranea]CUH83435.1 1,2-epoxyphenylacetyl-CoA isomerase [Thalassovita mediterranea]SIS34887.1 2-(1,2-epoxy-1,2-dihydrophenyl)acetyl-CoA isomerase [Thalassovita mediterranea]